MGYCPWGRKESNMTQQLSTHTRGNCVFNSLKKFGFFCQILLADLAYFSK